jgi:hypothetical protein
LTTFFVNHHLYPDNPHFFVVDVKKVIKLKGEPGTAFSQHRRGEQFWEIVIYTSGLDSSEALLGPYWLDVIGSEEDVDELINNKIKDICDLIDWSVPVNYNITDTLTAAEDRYGPVVYSTYPANGQTGVPIDSKIIIRLRDLLPATGVDISSIILTVDGFTVTPETSGNIYDCVVSYKPIVGY